jgi:hypothetical protein
MCHMSLIFHRKISDTTKSKITPFNLPSVSCKEILHENFVSQGHLKLCFVNFFYTSELAIFPEGSFWFVLPVVCVR